MFGFPHRQLQRVSRLVLVGVLSAVLVAPGAASAAKKSSSKCDAVTGWSSVAGRPTTLSRLGASGIYVWNEKGVWRLSVTHSDRRLQKFQGTITFDAPISTRPVGAEGTFGDVVQTNGSSASFAFANYGGVDGVAITAPCTSTVTVTGTIDGQTVSPDQVFLGSASVNPSAVPAVLTKSAPGATAAVPTTAAKDCTNPAWPAALQGRPAALKNNGKGAAPGMYLWAEKAVLRIALVTEPGKVSQADGVLTANADVRAAVSGLEGRKDTFKVDGGEVTFSLKSSGGLDGIGVLAPCATLFIIDATVNDEPLALFLGPTATEVPALPYLLTR